MNKELQKELLAVFTIPDEEVCVLRHMAEQTSYCPDPHRNTIWVNAFVETAANLLTAKLTDIPCGEAYFKARLAVFEAHRDSDGKGFVVARQWAAYALHRIGIGEEHYRVNVTQTVWNKVLHEFATRIVTICQEIAYHGEEAALRAALAA